jgi:hypothetical protein
MRELNDFIQNKSILGGRMSARTGESREGLPSSSLTTARSSRDPKRLRCAASWAN